MPEWTNFIELLSLAPGAWAHSLAIFSFLFFCACLLRSAAMCEGTRWPLVHMLVCALTLLPAIVLAGMLLLGAIRYPERAWLNLGIAALLYVPWYAGGRITRLARADTEGADVGWLAMGALITFPAGLLAALVFA
jgi:hypothetical protein